MDYISVHDLVTGLSCSVCVDLTGVYCWSANSYTARLSLVLRISPLSWVCNTAHARHHIRPFGSTIRSWTVCTDLPSAVPSRLPDHAAPGVRVRLARLATRPPAPPGARTGLRVRPQSTIAW